MFKSQYSHMWLQKSILSHVTTLTFVVTCDYIDFFLANVTVNHNVHTFTIILHGYLFHSFLINVVNYNERILWGGHVSIVFSTSQMLEKVFLIMSRRRVIWKTFFGMSDVENSIITFPTSKYSHCWNKTL